MNVDERSEIAGGGAPDGFAGGAGDLPRGIDRRLVICAIASVVGHLAFARGLDYLPRREDQLPPQIVQVKVIEPAIPEPPPEPVKPPEPAKPEPAKPQVHERPRPHDAPVVKHDTPPVDTPPVDHPPTTTDTTTTPVFGVTMESTSQAGSGPAMPIGNTTHPAPTGTPGVPVKPLAQPVAAVEITKWPVPQGRCAGKGTAKYTDEALAAAIEGIVVLDVTVDEHGRTRDITVVSGLSHGLTESAVAALKACTFTPAEKDGQPVPFRLRDFRYRFVLPEGQ
jgi:TonB family protein